ncbi:hypothetical protein N9Y42_04810 [Mariniblastus sp.]|nr:hypothetical protein [Mariniblastus sp.]
MKYTIRNMLIALVVCSIVAAIVASVMRSQARNADEELQVTVAFLVCDYLFASANEWPPDWEALKPHFVARFKNNPDFEFDHIMQHVDLDFDIDGPALMGIAINVDKSRAFRAIRSKSSFDEYRETDPNQIVLDHFRHIISH